MSQHGWGHGPPSGYQQQGYGPPPGYGMPGPGPMLVPTWHGGMAPTCRLCGAPTAIHSKVSTGGWVLFVVLLFACFPLCFLGLLIREHGQRCTRCFSMQGGMG